MTTTTPTTTPKVQSPPALRFFAYRFASFRPWWRSAVVSSLLNPVLFLLAIGVGIGSLVRPGSSGGLGGAGYVEFVGAGLLAASATQAAAGESMYPVMSGIKWVRTWHAAVATPVGISALVTGQFLWMAFRLLAGAAAYLVVLVAFGVVDRAVGVLAIPAAAICGMAIASPLAAFAATQQNDQWFTLIFRIAIMPMFLFSGTFFPVSQLPAALEWVARVTPLWHGVELSRGFILGGLGWGEALGHVGYLLVWTAAGWVAARRTFRERMTP